MVNPVVSFVAFLKNKSCYVDISVRIIALDLRGWQINFFWRMFEVKRICPPPHHHYIACASETASQW